MTTVTNDHLRTIYFPGISDHFQATAAAYRAYGQDAVALPLTSRESLALGMQVGRGYECLSFVITLGDLFLGSRQPSFDPARAALYVPDLTTKCVAVNFGARHREILREHGLGAVKILTPVAANNFEGLGETHALIGDLSWAGIVAVDMLIQLQQIIRPYELTPGAADATYQRALPRVVAATERGSIDAIIAALGVSASEFAAIPQDRSQRRPRIVLVGEYLLYNSYLNLDLVRQMERLGGEVEVNRYYKMFYGLHLGILERARALQDEAAYQQVLAANTHLREIEHRVIDPVKHLLTDRQIYAPPNEVLRDYAKPYYEPEISNGGVDWAEALNMVEHGASAVLQLFPFLCLGSIISAAMGSEVRHMVGGVPWLDVVFDSQGGTNIRTRLEAFMHQAAQFQRRGARPRPHQPTIPLALGGKPHPPVATGV